MPTKVDKTPAALAEVRDRVGLSQKQLAAALGVSPTLISRWESGDREPTAAQWLNLALALGVPSDYLLHTGERAAFSFRSQTTLDTAEKTAVGRVLNAAEAQVLALDSAWKLARKAPESFPLEMSWQAPQLARAAMSFRDALRLNRRITFAELKQAAEERGVRIFEWHLPPKISGFSHRGAFTVVFINREHPEPRRLFTLAHELAHVLFHLRTDGERSVVSIMASTRDPLEKQANHFAAELLMPADDMRAVVARGRDLLRRPMMLASVAEEFHVSVPALFYRLVEFGVFSWTEKASYFRSVASAPAPEFLVTDIDSQVDAALVETLVELLETDRITTGKLAEWTTAPRHVADAFIARRQHEATLAEDIYALEEIAD